MNTVVSKDGTEIAYTKPGDGPAVIIVGGGLDDGSENAPLASELSKRFTVYNYARRGRAGSGDAQPYALEREIEDIDALIAEAGDSVFLFGISSGGALALEATAAGLAVKKLAVYEVPYSIDADAAGRWQKYVAELNVILADDRRDDALELFMRLAGSSDDDINGAKNSPMWPGLKTIAHTLAYDAACLGDGLPPTDRLASITQPTLVATGSVIDPHMGGLQPGFFDEAADMVADSIPQGKRKVIEGQSHQVDPVILAQVLRDFFKDL